MIDVDFQINETHPMRSKSPLRFEADRIALELVGQRHSKRDLVDLVRWLIMDEAKTIKKIMEGSDSRIPETFLV